MAEQSTFLTMSALEQAQGIREGQFTSEALTQFYLDRIAEHNDTLNAFVSIQGKRALKRARAMDKKRGSGPDDLPLFAGVPTGIKDLVPTAWTTSRLGSRAYKYFVPPFNAEIVTRMQAGGFISLGKLATSEFGVLPVTEPDIHPPTRNPWDTERAAGGSSGGSGAAVAAGLLPIAQGSDGGGSVRIPAAFCHLYGFKPSISLLGNLHGRYNRLGISVMGPLARYVEDAAAMLDVMAGRPHGGAEDVSCLAASRRDPGKLRIHMVLESPIGQVDPQIADATRAVAATLESLGHTVVEQTLSGSTLEEFLPVWRYSVSGVPAISERLLRPVTRWLRVIGKKTSFEEASSAREKLAERVRDAFGEADILLSPTVPMVPPRIGAFEIADDPEKWFTNAARVGSLTAAFNLTTGPAATLPLGLTDTGLPYGVQIGSRLGRDHLVLALSRQLEQALPWHHRWAPNFGS